MIWISDPSFALWSLVLATLVLALIACYKHFTKLRRCGIHGPTPIPIVGNILSVSYTGFENIHAQWTKQYGNLYGYYMGFKLNVAVSDPEMLKVIFVKEFSNFTDRVVFSNNPKLVRNGLFFMRGRQWKRTRNLLTPSFSAGKLKHMMSIFNKCGETLTDNLQNQVGETVTLRKAFGRFTMDAIAATAFGLDIDSLKQEDEPFVKNISKVVDLSSRPFLRYSGFITSIIPGFGSLLYKLGFTIWDNDAVDFYERTGKALILDRMKNKNDRMDFLNLIINAEFDETKEHHVQNGMTMHDASRQELKDRLTLDEMNGTVFLFFLAGYETTANLLYFTTYCLAIHPDIDRRVAQEIEECIGQSEPTYESIGKLKYMDQVIQEVLRLYPPVSRLNRLAQKDIQIGDVVIPAGTVVNIPVWYIHHSPEFYPEPEVFDPDRWSTSSKGLADSVTFIPFGFGPRHCIGMRLAMLEAKLALTHALRKVRFVQTEKTQVPLQVSHFGTVRPNQPIEIGIEKR